MNALVWALAAGALASATASCAAASGCRPATAERLTICPLTISNGKAVHKFRVEVARTPEEQARGLMFRGSLNADKGMIFPLDPPRIVSFYMKNTVIPLDLIFIRADGTIASIAAETVPYSLDSIYSSEPVVAVLEIVGGRAAKLGITEGAKVSWTAPG